MKRRALIGLVAVIASSLAFFSCQGTSDVPPALKGIHETVPAQGDTFWLNVAAVGDWTVSVDYIDQDGWIHLDKASDSGKASVEVTVDPNDDESPRKARLIVKTSNHEVSKEITQMGKVSATTTAWLELPAFDQTDQLEYYVHDNDGGAYVNREVSGVRNWSFFYDKDNFMSKWVAYPLNHSLIGTGKRTDKWGMDPLVEERYQVKLLKPSGTPSSGYGGGWTRGHQIPSADRYDYAANVSTFYMTNMAPQQYDFNEGIWGHLEQQIRNWAPNRASSARDTMYVVTGPDYRNSSSRTGSSGGHSVLIPTHYWKALLLKKGDTYSAVGFYMPHTESIADGNFMDYVCSITELESKTGIDFFVNLPALLGKEQAQAIEDASPSETLKNW